MVAFRRPRNLKGIKKCVKKYQISKYVDEGSMCSSGNRMYNINFKFDSDSEAVMYRICKRCNKICREYYNVLQKALQ